MKVRLIFRFFREISGTRFANIFKHKKIQENA